MTDAKVSSKQSTYETVDRIRRSHAHARPNPSENPAWANCHMDCGILLSEIDRLKEAETLLSLLYTDMGEHDFTYRFLPHWRGRIAAFLKREPATYAVETEPQSAFERRREQLAFKAWAFLCEFDVLHPTATLNAAIREAYARTPFFEGALLRESAEKASVAQHDCQCATYCMVAVGAKFEPPVKCRGLRPTREEVKCQHGNDPAHCIYQECNTLNGTVKP